MEKSIHKSLINLLSDCRLSSYKYGNADEQIALERYLYNIELSKSFYPILSLIEVSLRNRLNEAIDKTVKPDWLIQELSEQDILLDSEYKKLQEAKSKLLKKRKAITKDHLIAELSLGFWIHLCTKKNTKHSYGIEKNFFRIVFSDYSDFTEFDKLSKSLSSTTTSAYFKE